ncbi:MAG: metallophosphoesterase [Ruminococcus flavefaciens]|nr:metallophosphoesterase [Ruminococcus flavefaciens]
MIYITGDTHGEYNDFIYRIRDYKPSKNDTIIVCGDFGFVWDDPRHRFLLAKLTALPFNIAFIDGNHEDFSLLNTYPVEEWHGGKVHRIAGNIVHLMRGQLFTIEGKTFFTMGGAYSVDKSLRKEGVSWWAEELPDSDDYKTAGETLEKCGYKADYVITHTVPESMIYCIGLVPDINDIELTVWLECLYGKLDFKKWFAGHFHRNRLVNDKFQILYDNVEVIE